MSPRFQNKLLTICFACLASIALVSVAIVLEVLAPKGTLLGWLVKTLPLAVAIPAVILGFDALCDRYYRRVIASSDQAEAEPAKPAQRDDWTDHHNSAMHRTNGAEVRTQELVAQRRRAITSGSLAVAVAVPMGNALGVHSAVARRSKWWIGQ